MKTSPNSVIHVAINIKGKQENTQLLSDVMNFKATKKQSKLLKLIKSFYKVQETLTQVLKMSCGFYLYTAKVSIYGTSNLNEFLNMWNNP